MPEFRVEPLEEVDPPSPREPEPWLFSPRRGYGCAGRARLLNFIHEDAPTGAVWQPDVYAEAAELARRVGARQIVDFGCGSGAKLIRFFEDVGGASLVGVDFLGSLRLAKGRYPAVRWLECNLDLWGDVDRVAAHLGSDGPQVLIAADVIEHLLDPRPLLATLRRLLLRHEDSRLVLSTPDRHRTRGVDVDDVPANRCHVREWTLAELGGVLSAAGLSVRRTAYTRSNLEDRVRRTAFVECAATTERYRACLESMPGLARAAVRFAATARDAPEEWDRIQQILFYMPQLRRVDAPAGSRCEEVLRVARAAGLLPMGLRVNDDGLPDASIAPRPVTVAVKVCNLRLDWLHESLSSIGNQSLAPSEVVVVDVGSRIDYRLALRAFLEDRLDLPFRILWSEPGASDDTIADMVRPAGAALAVVDGSVLPLMSFLELTTRCLAAYPSAARATTGAGRLAQSDGETPPAGSAAPRRDAEPAARVYSWRGEAVAGGSVVEIPVTGYLVRPARDRQEASEPTRSLPSVLLRRLRRILRQQGSRASSAARRARPDVAMNRTSPAERD